LNWKASSPESIDHFGRLSQELDDATAGWALLALRKVRDRDALRHFAMALESADEEVRYQAMAGLAEFANGHWVVAPAGGAVQPGDPEKTPFTTADTLVNFATMEKFRRSPDQCVDFWKAWWVANKAQITGR
jgi:hypothetical protein